MAIKALIFDCFGVLVLSGNQTLYRDFPERTNELHDLTKGSDYGYISRDEFNQTLSDMTKLSIAEVQDNYWKKNSRNEPVFDWVREVKQAGEYKVGLLSNIGKGWLDDFISGDERIHLFDEEVLSGTVGMTKPDPRIFELMASRLGVEPEECIMIDDILENIDGASRIGMKGVLFGAIINARRDVTRIIADNA
jgi:HAD superfamily hydrolase (TIGR01549 family)